MPNPPRFCSFAQLSLCKGRLSYDYYLWRTGTHNDLILIILAFGQLVVLSGVVRLTLLGSADHIDPTNLWDAVYNVSAEAGGKAERGGRREC